MLNMHYAKKRFGQNFLCDKFILQNIINHINPQNEEHIVEIGPGKGALTQHLLKHVSCLDTIEIDRDLAANLPLELACDVNKLVVHQQDALQTNFSDFGKTPLRIVGNLPYNISTPLLFHLLGYINHIVDMFFLLQKEVVERICAKNGQKKYGRLSVMLQYYCDVEHLFNVKPDAFIPVPKVDSAMIRLTPFKKIKYNCTNHKTFSKLVRESFSYRRKTIRNALKKYFNNEDFMKLNISPEFRPEQLRVKDFVSLANYYESSKSTSL